MRENASAIVDQLNPDVIPMCVYVVRAASATVLLLYKCLVHTHIHTHLKQLASIFRNPLVFATNKYKSIRFLFWER